MKKIFYLLIGLLLIPNTISADMAAPVIIEYEAIVNNPDGINVYSCIDDDNESTEMTCTKSDEKIPYGTKYTVSSDEYICINDNCTKFIDPKELTPIKDSYSINEDDLGDKIDIIALKDINIKKGPSVAYDTITTIKKGTIINGRDIIKEMTPWFYVEYNGIKGYIDSYNEEIAFDIKPNSLIAYDKVSIIDVNNRNTIKTLNVNDIVNANIGLLSYWSEYYYIEYDNIKGLIPKTGILLKLEPYNILLNKDTNLYKNGDSIEEENIIAVLPKGTIFKSEYRDDIDYTFYYEKDGLKGYIIGCDDYEYINTEDNNEIIDEIDEKEDNEIINKEEKKEEKITINKPKKDYTLYICIGLGIILSITALVIIILINKNKKENI